MEGGKGIWGRVELTSFPGPVPYEQGSSVTATPPPRTQRKWSLVGKGEEMRGPDGGSLADSEAR